MLKKKMVFLFDIDGTLAVDKSLYRGTKELLYYIRDIGGQAFFVTNNSTKSRRDYVAKFADWEIETEAGQFMTASYASSLYLKKNYDGKKIFVVGTPSFVTELKECGLHIVEQVEEDVDCVMVGFDASLTYEKAAAACELLFRENVDFIASNPDYRCPSWFGFIPDCGAICEMLRVTTNREPLFIGKPNAGIVELCRQEAKAGKEAVIIVGDRLYTDIACGINAGVDTALVYTGEAKAEDLKTTDYQPTYAFDTIYDFYQELQKAKE